MMDLLDTFWHIMFMGGWLIPTWLTAYGVKITAPQDCKDGDDYQTCYERHGPTHVLRNSIGFALMAGLIWPLTVGVLLILLFSKSVEGAVAITPMPKPKVVETDKMLAEKQKKTEEEIAADDLRLKEMQEETDAKVREILEGKVVDPYSREARKKFR